MLLIFLYYDGKSKRFVDIFFSIMYYVKYDLVVNMAAINVKTRQHIAKFCLENKHWKKMQNDAHKGRGDKNIKYYKYIAQK